MPEEETPTEMLGLVALREVVFNLVAWDLIALKAFICSFKDAGLYYSSTKSIDFFLFCAWGFG